MKVRTINEDFELRKEKRKKNQKAVKRLIFLVKFMLTTGLIVATAVLLALSPLFDIKRIEVRGAVHYTEESLVSISGVVKGVNGFKQTGSSLGKILTLRLGNSENLIIRNCPYVKVVKARFVLPGTVVMDITERTPAACLPYAGTSLLIDRDGYVLEALAQEKVQKLPSISGLKFENGKPGTRPEFENGEALQTAFRVLDEIRLIDGKEADKLYPRVDSIDVGNPGAVVMSLESRVRVYLGDLQDLNYMLSTVKTIFERNIKKEDKGILDFTTGENPVFTPESGG